MRVLIADDQLSVRSALRLLLEQEPAMSVSGEASDLNELMTSTGEYCPDLILLDWELPGCESKKLIPALRAKCPKLIIIVLSLQPEARREARASGADGFVSKGSPPHRVIEVIKSYVRPDKL